MTALPPSGEQFEIVHGQQRATIVEVGGGVREYVVRGRPVLDPYPASAMCDGGHGAPLIPWPNRLGDGRYRFDGVDYQVALSEPAKHNAIHGFLRWRPWQTMTREPSRVVVGTRLYPLTGYPFTLEVRIEYALDEDGLSVCTSATNLCDRACPYGAGQHPYLSPGEGLIDACTLEVAAGTRIVTDAERQLPSGRRPWAAASMTSAVRESSASSRSTTRSPISPATTAGAPSVGSPLPMARLSSCGWTRTTRSWSCSQGTHSGRRDGARVSPSSR